MIELPTQSQAEAYVIATVEGQIIRSGKSTSNIDVSEIEPGSYFISIQTKDAIYREKVLIIH